MYMLYIWLGKEQLYAACFSNYIDDSYLHVQMYVVASDVGLGDLLFYVY